VLCYSLCSPKFLGIAGGVAPAAAALPPAVAGLTTVSAASVPELNNRLA